MRQMQAVYQFYVIINENTIEKTTVFILQCDKTKDLMDNIFVLSAVLSEIFHERGLSGLPKMSEKHYFSNPSPQIQSE